MADTPDTEDEYDPIAQLANDLATLVWPPQANAALIVARVATSRKHIEAMLKLGVLIDEQVYNYSTTEGRGDV